MKNNQTQTIDMQAIATKANELNNDIELVKKALKRIASVKTRIKKMPGRSDYNEKLTEALQEEQLLKSVRDYIAGPKQNVNTLTEEQIADLDYDATCRAIRCIQSKKTHTRWLTTTEGDNDEFREACRIEQLLLAHKAEVQPFDTTTKVRKSDIKEHIEILKQCNDLTAEEALNKLLEIIE